MSISALARAPRVSLAHLPTPLEPLPRLAEALGASEGIWIKRDDATGLALGGNKVRKLEFLIGEAQAAGATSLITVGGVQSNHARQTAAAAARLGLRCQLVLAKVVPMAGTDYESSGNVLLDRLFGAEVFIEADEAAAALRIRSLLDAAEAQDERVAVFPAGGSTATGAFGYVAAAAELDAQLRAESLGLTALYVATSTAGTAAGLVCGLSTCRPELPVVAVCTAGTAADARARLDPLVPEICQRLELAAPEPNAVRFRDEFLGEGYGIPHATTLEAVRLCADLEGLLLDPVYTGKAMAALIADVRAGRCDGPILFWHTGGAPGLFAYRSSLL
jgi:D-cysteine desulfhydrase/L-cysteate sulfo-lyase